MQGSGDGVLLVGHCAGWSRCAGAATAASGTTIAAEDELVAPPENTTFNRFYNKLYHLTVAKPLFFTQKLFF
jgi:hypothetical protein